MADIPLVSVVIPCYNHGRYLPEAVESVAGQTFSAWEIVIVDDGSRDAETLATSVNLGAAARVVRMSSSCMAGHSEEVQL